MTQATTRHADTVELAEQVKKFVEESREEPIYVRSLMEKFGQSPDEKDSIRSLVWAMISRKDLILGDGLTLSTEK